MGMEQNERGGSMTIILEEKMEEGKESMESERKNDPSNTENCNNGKQKVTDDIIFDSDEQHSPTKKGPKSRTLHQLSSSTQKPPATPRVKPQGFPPRSTGHARFRRKFTGENIAEELNGPNPTNLQLNTDVDSYSDSLKRGRVEMGPPAQNSRVEMGPPAQNIAAKRVKDVSFRQVFNGGTSTPNLANAVELPIIQTVGATKPEALKVQQLSFTGAATTHTALQLPSVSSTQPAPNVESLIELHRQVYSVSSSEMQRLLSRFSGPQPKQPETNQALVYKPNVQQQLPMFFSSWIPNVVSDQQMNPATESLLRQNHPGASVLPSQGPTKGAGLQPSYKTFADLNMELESFLSRGDEPFPMRNPMSPSDLAAGPSSNRETEEVVIRNVEQEDEEEDNGEEELDLDLKL